MNIAIILSNPPGYSETFFRSKIKGLQKNGFNVVLYSRTRGDFDLCPVRVQPKVVRNPILQVFYFVKVYVGLLFHIKTLRRYIRMEREEGTSTTELFKKIYLNSQLLKSKADWLHFGFATMAIGSETVAKAIDAKMAVSFRGFDIAVYPVKNPGCYERLWRYVDQVHTLSDYLVKEAKRQELPDTVAVRKIPPAVNVDEFNTTMNISNSKPIFITIGRLHWMKNYPNILEALALLKKRNLEFEYHIIGEGSEYERIAFTAHDLGLGDDVIFHGKIPHQEVKEHLEKANIYIQYSHQEGFCNAVLEAQAMGKLCVVSDAEGLAENVLHEKTGWVVQKGKPELLAEQIQKVLSLFIEEKQAVSTAAIKRVREEFNLEKQGREFMEFYREM